VNLRAQRYLSCDLVCCVGKSINSNEMVGSCVLLRGESILRIYIEISLRHLTAQLLATLETRNSLTNCPTHLCKCNDVSDLTSVIKIRLKKNWFLSSGLSRSLKVIGTDTNRPAIYDFLLVFSSNFVPKTHRFRDIGFQTNAMTLKSELGVRQGHWTCHHSIERIWLWVRGHLKSSKVVPFDRLVWFPISVL